MVHNLVTRYGGVSATTKTTTTLPLNIKTDEDSLRETFRFIRSPEDDNNDNNGGSSNGAATTWEIRLAKRYYSRLYREYCIADLSRYETGQIGLRWRTHREVVSGKGQFTCGARCKGGCVEGRGLASFEVPFGYVEAGVKKQALVKVRLCPTHAYQLQEMRKYKKKLENEDDDDNNSSSSSSSSGSSDDGEEEEEEQQKRNKNKKKRRPPSTFPSPKKMNKKKSRSSSVYISDDDNNDDKKVFEGLFE